MNYKFLVINFSFAIKRTLFCSMLFFVAGCTQPNDSEQNNSKDFSNDEVVLEEVNRIGKHKLSKDDICIERPEKFKDLVLVGFFAHDRGCDGGMRFYKGKEFDANNDIPKVMKDNGWEDRAKREFLALEWVKNVSLAWENPMEEADDDFKSQEEHTFMPPTVKTESGEIIVAVWVREPAGMNPDANFYLYTSAFDLKTGDFIRSQITDRFTINFEL